MTQAPTAWSRRSARRQRRGRSATVRFSSRLSKEPYASGRGKPMSTPCEIDEPDSPVCVAAKPLGRRILAWSLPPLVALVPAQALAQGAEPAINAADTAWMISATGLVLMMSMPGLALFYCGMVRKKNVLATMAQTLLCVCVGSILWLVACYRD